jgi:hypothetical protein
LWGCVRNIDPQKADEEVRKLLKDVPGFDWEPGAESRLAFPDSDTLPVPPIDDNASREITLRIQKEDAYGDGNISSILDTRQWRKSLPADANGSILLDLETSMELALLHSREFQQQKEALYLSALDVTYERFPTWTGSICRSLGSSQSGKWMRMLQISRQEPVLAFGASLEKGTTWVTSLANRLSIELSGGDVEVGGSLANLTVTQPVTSWCQS